MSFWELGRELATRVIPEDCTTEIVWVPAYDPPGGDNEFCTTSTQTITRNVYTFIPDDPNVEIGTINETSSGGPPESTYNGVPGIWVLTGTITSTEEVEDCTDTAPEGAPNTPDVSGGQGRYVTYEVCTPAREELYVPTDWEEYCYSNSSLAGSLEFAFTPSNNPNGIMVGLIADYKTPDSYRDIEHGAYVYRGGSSSYLIRIIESGRFVSSSMAISGGTEVTIQRIGGQVKYFAGSSLIHTSSELSGGTVRAIGYLYTVGDTIQGATMAAAGTGYIEAEFQALTSQSFETTGSFILADMMLLDVDAVGMNTNAIDTSFTILAVHATESANPAAVDASFSTLDVYASYEAEPVPEYSFIDAGLLPLDVQMYGSTAPNGTIDASFMPLAVRSWTSSNGAGICTELCPFDVTAIHYVPLDESNHFVASGPAATIQGYGQHVDFYGELVAPSATIAGIGGGMATLSAPAATIAAIASFNESGVATLTAPAASAVAGASFVENGIAELIAPSATLEGFSGGIATLVAPTAGIVGAATRVYLGWATLNAPQATVSGSGAFNESGVAVLTAPSAELGASGWATLVGPAATISGFASAALLHSQSIVMNASNRAVSTYTTGFKSYIRLDDKHYGIGDDNVLYLLEGETNDGSNIEVVGVTHNTDFGVPNKTRVPAVYVDAKSSSGLTLSALLDDTDLWRYQTTRLNHPSYNTKKVNIGSRLSANRWAFEIRNIAGNDLSVRAISPAPILKSSIAEK